MTTEVIRSEASMEGTGTAPGAFESCSRSGRSRLTLFLCGDVMPGRGIDQVLPDSCPPRLHESYVRSAHDYVALAEKANGPIPAPVSHDYIWGDALAELERRSPDVRLINLETAVTLSEDAWPGKAIHYRMHPKNVACLTAARIDCCVLANNHVLDWGHAGLEETLSTLRQAGLETSGAGHRLEEARAPAVLDIADKGRVLVFAFGQESSGVAREWAASESAPGVNLLPDFSNTTVSRIGRQVRAVKRPGDVVVASLHWGSNWGYQVAHSQRSFARRLIDEAGVDVVHGHSSHHPRGIEVHHGRPIFYGCGDLINDYEGISGYEVFRPDLSLLYFAVFDGAQGGLTELDMIPMRIRRFRLERAAPGDAAWLRDVLDRECGAFGGVRVDVGPGHALVLRWAA